MGAVDLLEYTFWSKRPSRRWQCDGALSSCSIQVSTCQFPWSTCRGPFGDTNSTHYRTFWLSNVDQTSREPSRWSNFLPFSTCKVFQNDARLPHSHGHPKCFIPPKNLCPRNSMLSISPFKYFVSLCWVFIKFEAKFNRATVLEISFLHFRNYTHLHNSLKSQKCCAFEMKLTLNIKLECTSLVVSEAWLNVWQFSSHAFSRNTF
jgi:hypothetical protein